MQSTEVTLEAKSMHFFTSKDQNPVMGSMLYYGAMKEIWEVYYTMFFDLFFK